MLEIRNANIKESNAYDAMTEERVYRKAMTHEAAIEEIRQCAGIQFDPQIAQKFFDVIRAGDTDNLNVTISGGIVKYNGDLEEALKKADRLLYKAKEDGRNKVIIEDE